MNKHFDLSNKTIPQSIETRIRNFFGRVPAWIIFLRNLKSFGKNYFSIFLFQETKIREKQTLLGL